MTETFLTVEQAAQRLQTTPYTVRAWLRLGRLRGVKFRRIWRVPESALQAPVLTPAADAGRDGSNERSDRERFAEFFALLGEFHQELETRGWSGIDGVEVVGAGRAERMSRLLDKGR